MHNIIKNDNTILLTKYFKTVKVTFHTHARFGHNNTPMLQCQAVASVFLSDFGGRSRPYIGLSVLRAFVLSSIHCNNELSDVEKATFAKRIDNGVLFPDCNHGDYRNNFVAELYYTKKENHYNILSLANTLFLLEIHTLQTEAIHKQTKKTGNPRKRKTDRH